MTYTKKSFSDHEWSSKFIYVFFKANIINNLILLLNIRFSLTKINLQYKSINQ